MKTLIAPHEYFSEEILERYYDEQRLCDENYKSDSVDIDMSDILAAYYTWYEYSSATARITQNTFSMRPLDIPSLKENFERLMHDVHERWGDDVFLICAEQLNFFSNGNWFKGADKVVMTLLLLYQLEKAGYSIIFPEGSNSIVRLVCAANWHIARELYSPEVELFRLEGNQSAADSEIQIIARVLKKLANLKNEQTLWNPTAVAFQKICRLHGVSITRADNGNMICRRDVRQKMRCIPYIAYRICSVKYNGRLKLIELEQILNMTHDLGFVESEAEELAGSIRSVQTERLETLFRMCNIFDKTLMVLAYVLNSEGDKR